MGLFLHFCFRCDAQIASRVRIPWAGLILPVRPYAARYVVRVHSRSFYHILKRLICWSALHAATNVPLALLRPSSLS